MFQESNLKPICSSPSLIELCGIRAFPEGKAFVFSVGVTCPATPRVYLEIVWADGNGDGRSIAFVETERFIAAWRREPYGFNKEAAHGTLDRERLERKYPAVQNSFAHSRVQPVPLSQVVCRRDSENRFEPLDTPNCGRRYVSPRVRSYYVDFDSGVTRSFWLIANGASAFPVEVDSSEAAALHDVAGLPDMPPTTVGRLFETTRNMRTWSPSN